MITFSKLGHYGRLGNQLWQIASTIGIAEKSQHDFCFPDWEWQKFFPNKLPTCSDTFDAAKVVEKTPYFTDYNLNSSYDWDLYGYFQSWKYFANCEDKIRHYFHFPKLPLKGVAVHVRHGDYLYLNHIHPVLPLEYYQEAMKQFKGEAFTIFSDDIEWCKENFTGKNVDFFEPNGNDFLDFSYMAGFSKFIIANSSYSWWAAWLSGSSEIIAPKTWVTTEDKDDRVLPAWSRL